MAVGAHPPTYTPKIGTRVSRPSLSSIQIWSFGLEEDASTTRCEALLCIESGHANELKWCPLPSHDSVSFSLAGREFFIEGHQLEGDTDQPRKLGLLAGTFEDGSFSVFAVPYPRDLQPSNTKGPIYSEQNPFSPPFFAHETINLVKADPILRIEPDGTSCWTFGWANSEVVAIGYTNGGV